MIFFPSNSSSRQNQQPFPFTVKFIIPNAKLFINLFFSDRIPLLMSFSASLFSDQLMSKARRKQASCAVDDFIRFFPLWDF